MPKWLCLSVFSIYNFLHIPIISVTGDGGLLFVITTYDNNVVVA